MNDSLESSRLYEFCQLIEYLIHDIQHLEEEVVKTRYQLCQYLPSPAGTALFSDILSDLGGRYNGHPAYDSYLELYHDNLDPMESEEWVERILRAANGVRTINIYPLIKRTPSERYALSLRKECSKNIGKHALLYTLFPHYYSRYSPSLYVLYAIPFILSFS